MRRLALILAATLWLAGAAGVQAQRQYNPEWWVGAHGGVTMSRVPFVPSAPQSFLPGMIIGVTAKYTEERNFGIIGELNLQQRGWRENYHNLPFSYERTLTYVQFALLTHVYFGNRRFRGYFNAGPEAAYMIGSKISSNFDYTDYANVAGYPVRNRVNQQLAMPIGHKFDYGISASLGMEVFIKSRHALDLECRFYYGIGNIFADKKADYFAASRGFSIEAMLGYSFKL